MKIGNKIFNTGEHTYVMGILNVTPDSFSDGGKVRNLDEAIKKAEQMVMEGADIIDIGGESTRPGFIEVSLQEEIDRTAPVIERIKETLDVPVSIDTYKYQVAEAALMAGADLLNDIWGFRYDEGQLAALAAKWEVPVCLMHNARKAYEEKSYDSYMDKINAELMESYELAVSAGVKPENIILDPGLGFGFSYEENMIILSELEKLKELPVPVLLGTSRKSFIGLTLDLPVDERMEGTLATTALAVEAGLEFVRVHDVKENVRLIKMLESIRSYKG